MYSEALFDFSQWAIPYWIIRIKITKYSVNYRPISENCLLHGKQDVSVVIM